MRRFLDWASAGDSQQSSNQTSDRQLVQHYQNQQGPSIGSPQAPSNGQASQTNIVTGSQNVGLASGPPPQQSASNSNADLEIQHLTKLLHDIKYYQASSSPLPTAAGSQNQRDFIEKVHKTLPLFLNVFGNGPLQTASGVAIHQMTNLGGYSTAMDFLDTNQRSDSNSSSKTNSPLPPLTPGHHHQVIPSVDKFPDLLPFSFTIARLFVSEVRQRASNKHAEDASLAILRFINDGHQSSIDETSIGPENTSTTSSQGWNLLLSLNTLVWSQNQQIIKLLCEASLPSTLIKCLYLFFDLALTQSEPQPSDQESGDTNQAVNNRQHRKLVSNTIIKAFTQLLVQLCSHQSAIDELIKKDDLRLLMGIASSQCLPHNRPWRRTAFQTLAAISRNMRDNFMYIEHNICIQIFVENMHRIHSLALANTDEFIEMIKCLLDFLYNLDVNNRNQPQCLAPIVEQFKASRIVELIEELIVKIDDSIAYELQASKVGSESDSSRQASQSTNGLSVDDYRRHGRRLIQSLSIMAKINVSQNNLASIMMLQPLAVSRFEMLEQFKMQKPSARNCILNLEAIRLLKMAWSKCHDSYLIESVLDTTISLFNDDKYNYFIFESQQLLVYYMTSCNFKQLPFKIKQKLFKFLEFVIIETNYIPCLELGTLGTIIKDKQSSDTDLKLVLVTFIACLRFNTRFSDIFRDIGLLEIVVELLILTMQQAQSLSSSTGQELDKLEVLYLLLETSQYLLAGPNNLNCTQFNESGAARHVFNCLSNPEFYLLFSSQHSGDDNSAPVALPNSALPQTAGYNSRNSTPLSAQIRPPTVHCNQWPADLGPGHSRLTLKQIHKVAFTIIRQLILSSTGDEHLANLLGLLARNLDDLKSLEADAATTMARDDQVDDDNQASSKQTISFTSILSQEINLKICILKSLMIVLKDNHRCRTLFRKVGGFIYIVSSLVTLERSISPCDHSGDSEELETRKRWRSINQRRIWRLVKNSLMTIVIAIRSEPANLRAFSENVIGKFTEAVRRLGCFRADQRVVPEMATKRQGTFRIENFESFRSIFLAPPTRDFSTISQESIKSSDACCQLFRFLFDMSLDMGDGTGELELQLERFGHLYKARQGHCHPSMQMSSVVDSKSMSFDQSSGHHSMAGESSVFKRRTQLNMAPKRPPSLDLNLASLNSDLAKLTYPCIVVAMMDLIPSCPSDELTLFTCLVIRSLFKHERNQQLLCEAGMISKLLSDNWRFILLDKSHFLHDSIEFMVQQMTRQLVSAKELRQLLRLGDPLKCKNLDDIELSSESDEEGRLSSLTNQETDPVAELELHSMIVGEQVERPNETTAKTEKIPQERLESLLNMMSDDRCGNRSLEPPFVEFDTMSSDGYSSIFLPSIAPVNAKSVAPSAGSFLNSTLDVHTNEKSGILGGVGTTERQFPPPGGFTFSTWICIEKFRGRSSDANHNIRLLTIYRGSAATGKEYACFRLQISALDRALTVSSQETPLFDGETQPAARTMLSASASSSSEANRLDPDSNLRIWTPELLLEGKWHHIAVSMSRGSGKQSSASVYVDGALIHSQRMSYISQFVGLSAAAAAAPISGGGPAASQGSSSCSAAAYVNAFIGSLPQLRFQLKTLWKQGPCHLIEESLSASFVSVIHSLGPNFIGNFQTPNKLLELAKSRPTSGEPFGLQQATEAQQQVSSVNQKPQHQPRRPLSHHQSISISGQPTGHAHLSRVSSTGAGNTGSGCQSSGKQPTVQSPSSLSQYQLAEERVMMSLDARATSLMTLSRMRRIYTRFDCRQVSRMLGLTLHENSVPILLLHNTGLHLNGPSRGIGAITIGHQFVRCFVPSPLQQTLSQVGGCSVLLGLVAQAQTRQSLELAAAIMVRVLRQNSQLQSQMDSINGYQILSVFYWNKKSLLSDQVLRSAFDLITGCSKWRESTLVANHQTNSLIDRPLAIKQLSPLRDLICENFDLWLQTDMLDLTLEFIHQLISSAATSDQASQLTDGSAQTLTAYSATRSANLKCLRDMDLLARMLRLLSQQQQELTAIKPEDPCESRTSDNKQLFNNKSIYLIKQTVFELLNRTPRQSDILYFGQFLASLLPSKEADQQPAEMDQATIELRNILLKSLLQMMTKNNQLEVNQAMQSELVKILGFDWFMLFIGNAELDPETINLGFFNLMVVLSNESLYQSFKQKGGQQNGGWLKESTFPSMDGKFNIQLLGVHVGAFFGAGARRKSIRQEALEAANFYLLTCSLRQLVHMQRIYLMMFLAMMDKLSHWSLDGSVAEQMEAFERLDFDLLCDSLVGDTHHKRRQTLANVQLRCQELTVCLVYMLRELMWRPPSDQQQDKWPSELIKFLMYLYNNNKEFQHFCRQSSELADALCACLAKEPANDDHKQQHLCPHQASRDMLEFSRLIILDSMSWTPSDSAPGGSHQPQEPMLALERFLDGLAGCDEARDELVDMLLRQALLMCDSLARHNSIKTLAASDQLVHFRTLLVSSVQLAQIVVDKIWLRELYVEQMGKQLQIVEHLLALAEQVIKFGPLLPTAGGSPLLSMQRSLGRLLLFLLAEPARHMSEQILQLDLLKKIHDNRTIVIANHAPSSQSAEFFVCLTYCLMNIIEENSSQQAASGDEPQSLGAASLSSSGTKELMLCSLARKVWDLVYQSKRGLLSEALEVSLSLPAFTLDTSPDLLQLKPDIQLACQRHWSAFVEASESPARVARRQDTESGAGQPGNHSASGQSSAASVAANLLSGKLTRVVNAASFVSRVVGATAGSIGNNVNLVGERLIATQASGRPRPRSAAEQPTADSQASQLQQPDQRPLEFDSTSGQTLDRRELALAMRAHLSIVAHYVESQLSAKSHKLALHRYLCDEWQELEDEQLLRERALFGPERSSSLDKWCLDLTEGPRRMRKKMANNTRHFYQNYPYSEEQFNPDNKSLRYRPPMSLDSREYHLRSQRQEQRLLDRQPNQEEPSGGRPASSTLSQSRLESLEPVNDDADAASFVDFSPEVEAEANSAREQSESLDSLSVLRLLERNERISHMFRCSRVQGLDTYEGLMLFGREHFYLIDGFTLLKTREIRDIDSLPSDAHDPIIPNSTPNIMAQSSKKVCAKFAFDSVVEVHKRRYLLQPIALEVFSSDGRNTLVVFPRNIRNKVYSRLMTVATQLTSSATESLAGQKSNVSVEGGSGLLSNLIGETSVTQRWLRGELSNFQYLMNLNTIAGRSYNDLMQYPIFPWILADYHSHELDLGKPSSFRDLSRPVGAQTADRLEQFKRRFADWDDHETPPYHYGTFYSSAMIVASYMVRMEPFTQHFLRLQGGHFDLADRMFHSIQDSWLSASKHNMADIKELIPEFFYLPEFLRNDNSFDLGIKQNGQKLHHVLLPPWAKGDAREFIRLHRCALESDYVSAHLHEWIDLIFGYKQQGQAAIEAVNVFHHLFYEGNVDIYNTDIDPIKKNAVIGFINNFGQVPKQLFKKPHPARKVHSSSNSAGSQPLGVQPTAGLPLTPTNLLAAAAGPARVLTKWPHLLRQTAGQLKELRGPVGQIVQLDRNLVAVEQNKLLIPPEYCRYVAWGHADRSLRLALYESERAIFVWEPSGEGIGLAHEVLCCAIPNQRTMITAGTEALICVWKIDKMKSLVPLQHLYGHVEPVTCLAASQAYSILVSGSRDRTAIIWDLNKFTFVRQLGGGARSPSHHGPISAIAINDSTGDIATCALSWLYLWTINGELLAQIDSLQATTSWQMPMGPLTMGQQPSGGQLVAGQVHLLSVCFSQFQEWDAHEVIATGASDGTVALWSLRFVQKPKEKAEEPEQAEPEVEPEPEVDVEKECEEEWREANEGEGGSGPIAIRGQRRRTSTMNSDWVRLSASSGASAAGEGSTPVMQIMTPTGELLLDRSPSVESLAGQAGAANGGSVSPTVRLASSGQPSGDELDGQSMSRCNLVPEANDSSLIKFSKSDNSLVGSFVMLAADSMGHQQQQQQAVGSRSRPKSSTASHPPERDFRQQRVSMDRDNSDISLLRPDHEWTRELYLRTILRRDNRNKTATAAITSLTISKDHKTIYVGDANGKISSWSTS